MELHGPIRSSLERFIGALRRLGLPGKVRGILAAASGGPDSTALSRLLALARDRGALGHSPPPLWLGHVHHGLRGGEADADADFARDLAGALGFRFLEVRVDVRTLARERGLSIEAAARSARYSTFQAWTEDHPIDSVLLGHTADDQAETVLLRLLQHASLRGLGGMPEERPLSFDQAGPFPRIGRPLLRFFRSEILTVLDALGQPFREDRTNRDRSILRNRIRLVLLPLLREDFEPSIGLSLLKVSRFASEAARDLDAVARDALESAAARREAGCLELDGRVLRGLPPTVLASLLESACRELARARGGSIEGTPTRRMLEPLLSWLFRDLADGSRFRLGRSFLIEHRRGRFTLRSFAETSLPGSPPTPVRLPVPGAAIWGDWEIRSEPVASGSFQPGPEAFRGITSPSQELVDLGSISGPLAVRARREGDRFHPLGAPGSKKLKEFFRERGVPPEMRDLVPLVADASDIVWVVGHRIAHACRVRPESTGLLRLSAARRSTPPR